jgi:hypothetical protein
MLQTKNAPHAYFVRFTAWSHVAVQVAKPLNEDQELQRALELSMAAAAAGGGGVGVGGGGSCGGSGLGSGAASSGLDGSGERGSVLCTSFHAALFSGLVHAWCRVLQLTP